jgi:cysteine desulfurase
VGRSEVYIRVLSDRGIYVSGGSACSRGKKSHVLTAMRVSGKNADAALRVSLCPETTAEDIDAFCDGLKEALKFF